MDGTETRPRGFGLVANLAILLLTLFAFVSVVKLAAGAGELVLRLRAGAGQPQALDAAGEVYRALSRLVVLQVLTFMAYAPVVAAWVVQAVAGAGAIGAVGPRVPAPVAAASFIVPLANLWVPYRAVAEAWRASRDPGRWRSLPVPPLVRGWWACWLAFLASVLLGYAGSAALAFVPFPEAVTSLAFADLLPLAADAFGAAAAVLLTLVVGDLSDHQDAWHEALRAGSRAAPAAAVARAATPDHARQRRVRAAA